MEHVNVYQTDDRPLLEMTVGCNVTLLAEIEPVHLDNFIASRSDRLAAPTVSAEPTAATPALRIALAYQRRNRDLLLTITFDGAVYNPYGLNDNTLVAYPTPAGRNIGMGEELTWGDGTEYTVSGGPQRCANPGEQNVLHQVKDSYQLHKKYKKSGEYTLGYTYFACGLTGGKISGSLTIKVP